MDNLLNQIDFGNNIDKADILQIIATGIRENQSLAKYFAETVIFELQKKLKNLNIQTSAIEINGKKISEEIHEDLKKGISEDLKKVSDTISKKLKNIIPDDKKLSLGDVVKNIQDSVAGASSDTSEKISKISKGINKNLESATSNLRGGKQDEININSLLGVTPSMSILTSTRYQKTIRKLLDNIEKNLPTGNKLKFGELSISSLLQPPSGPLASMFLSNSISGALRWGKIQKKVLGSIEGAFKEDSVKFKTIHLSDIFQPPGGVMADVASFIRVFQWDGLQHKIIKKLSGIIDSKDAFSFDGGIKFSDIFSVDKKTSLLTSMKWNQLQRLIMGKVGGSFTNIGNAESKEISPSSGFESLEEDNGSVRIGGFTSDAIKDLAKIPGLDKIGSNVTIQNKKDGGGGGGLGILGTLGALGLGLVGGGLVTAISSWFDDGPLKGMKKALGMISLKVGEFVLTKVVPGLSKMMSNIISKVVGGVTKMFGKTAGSVVGKSLKTVAGGGAAKGLLKVGGKFLSKALKFLPLVGTVIQVGSAISRVVKGDFVGGLLDLASGVAGIFPGIGTALSIAIDVFSAARDMKTGGSKEAASGKLNQMIKKFITEKLEYFPGIGTLVRISKALGAAVAGDWKTAGLYLAGAIPGFGWLLSTETIEKAGESNKSITQIIRESMNEKIRKGFKSLPSFIKNPIYKLLGIKEDPEDPDNLVLDVDEDGKKKSLWKRVFGKDKKDDEILLSEKTKESVTDKKNEDTFDTIESRNITRGPIYDDATLNSWVVDDDEYDDIYPSPTPDDHIEIIPPVYDVRDNHNSQAKTLSRISSEKEQYEKETTTLLERIGASIDNLSTHTKSTPPSPQPPPSPSPLPQTQESVTSDAGIIRDPAYLLRVRVWDRMRSSYAIV